VKRNRRGRYNNKRLPPAARGENNNLEGEEILPPLVFPLFFGISGLFTLSPRSRWREEKEIRRFRASSPRAASFAAFLAFLADASVVVVVAAAALPLLLRERGVWFQGSNDDFLSSRNRSICFPSPSPPSSSLSKC